jgi:general secretion pathway protein B
MSYILDALKRAERERGISRVPTLATVHELRKSRRRYLWAIAGSVLLSVVTIVWFFMASSKVVAPPQKLAQNDAKADGGAALSATENSKTSDITNKPPLSSESPEAKQISRSHNVPSLKPDLAGKEPVAPKTVEAEPKAGMPMKTAAVSRESEKVSLPLGESSSEEKQEARDSAVNVSTQKQSQTEPMAVTLQEAVNKMTLNIHVYSEVKGERMVFINGKKWLEGDYVEGKYLLKEITPQGAVLSYEGKEVILRPGRK